MAEKKRVQCIDGHRGPKKRGQRRRGDVVKPGEVLDANDPRVKAAPECFVALETLEAIEQATAGPGELREMRRGVVIADEHIVEDKRAETARKQSAKVLKAAYKKAKASVPASMAARLGVKAAAGPSEREFEKERGEAHKQAAKDVAARRKTKADAKRAAAKAG